jgi:hypothetical protein
MSAILDRIRTKVTRAKQHIQDFQLGLIAFLETKPYAVVFKENSETGKRIYYISKADSVPDTLTAIAADVIQNLRSPLDQIAYQLVLAANGGLHPAHKDVVYYPITSAPSEYPALCRRNMKGVRDEVIQAIDATEPYKGGKGHALWRLNELNKPDKHQLLIGAGAYGASVEFTREERFTQSMAEMGIKIDDLPAIFIRDADVSPLYVGRELYIQPLNEKVNEKRRFNAQVAFDHPGIFDGEPAIKTLQDTANLVDDIIVKLGTFLP